LASSLDIKNPAPGLNYRYYEGRWEKLPNLDSLSPRRSGTIGQFVIPDENSNDNFAVRYSGYIKIPADGFYTFYVNSDDGADIVIDNGLVADNDGRHAPQERSGTIVLKKGYHGIRVGFFQASGGKVIDVGIEGPGLPKQRIPAEILFH
jgi:hypothetical protein